ncbi:MAG: hypothetical protein ACYDC1_08670 [Limisphaerales bacterium]
MKAVISLLIIAAVVWFAMSFRDYAGKSMRESEKPADVQYAPGRLPGLPKELEGALEAAKREGPEGLKKWLAQNRNEVMEPRLTDIELDYVILAGRENPAEARRVLNVIKQRIASDSPAHQRFGQLDRAYP